MPPRPKDPGTRRRRNLDQPQWRKLPAEGRTGKAPPLPPKKPGWLKKTREQWAELWRSPMATKFLPADLPALERWAYMQEAVNRGEVTGLLMSELRQLEDRFALSPLARRRQFLEVGDPQAPPEAEAEEPRRKASGRARLRAV